MTAPSRILQSKWVGGFSCSAAFGRHLSSSDLAVGKPRLPYSERDGGKDCTSCKKNSSRLPCQLCMAMYSWAKSAKLFWSTEILSPCFEVNLVWGFLKTGKLFFLMGSWIDLVRSTVTVFQYSVYCFFPTSSSDCTVSATAASIQFLLSRVTSSGKSSRKGLPIFLITSDRLFTWRWKVRWEAWPVSWFLGVLGHYQLGTDHRIGWTWEHPPSEIKTMIIIVNITFTKYAYRYQISKCLVRDK